ncbi:TPA: fimbrial protein [Aeromonas hydrophila]|uniref:fimbrial protein n=1 Tax=Aeromonas hydrophila TaxID=644 RepID=UPI0028DA2B0C|nr:fimbrial protein [Aeromonas hydrophila]
MVILLIIFSCRVLSYDTIIDVKANLIGNTCTVQKKTMTIDMGNVTEKDFINHSGDGLWAREQPFSIVLTDCQGDAVGVMVNFKGEPDLNNSALLSISEGGAKGLAIRLMDNDKNLIDINANSKVYALDSNKNINELTFYARYIMNEGHLTPGKANATSTFILEFL